jgi:hypothetical protein
MLGIQFDTLILGIMIGAVAALLYARRGDRIFGLTARLRDPDEKGSR